MRRLARMLDWLWLLLPGRVRGYLSVRFGDVRRDEAVSYAVWGAMGLAVGVPEIWAAVAGTDFYWPTISTTVGHLEDRWAVVALIPVALIVMSCYSLFKLAAPRTAVVHGDFKALARTDEGRLTKEVLTPQELDGLGARPLPGRERWHVLPYFLLATAVVVVTAVVASRSDNRFLVGYVLYSLIAIVWVIVPNVASYWFKKDVPFTTMFFTVRGLGRRIPLVGAIVAALLVILLLHLAFYPWPSLR